MSDEEVKNSNRPKPPTHPIKMDGRCPRQLENLPQRWCPLAVLRLKAVRNAGRELTEKEEANLPGCPWAIDHQLSNYCFFSFINQSGDGVVTAEAEIASSLYISPETIKKIEKTALQKLKEQPVFKEIQSGLSKGESVIADRFLDEDSNLCM